MNGAEKAVLNNPIRGALQRYNETPLLRRFGADVGGAQFYRVNQTPGLGVMTNTEPTWRIAMKKTVALTIAAAALATGGAVAVPQLAGAATCDTRWGSQAKTLTTNIPGTVTAVRAGQHDCYDRLVLDASRSGLGYSVAYVKQVHNEGQGAVVALRGGAFLQITEKGQATRRLPMPSVTGYRTFRQVAWAGSFEGYTTVGLGVRTRLPFRVFRTGTHLVIDVAHTW